MSTHQHIQETQGTVMEHLKASFLVIILGKCAVGDWKFYGCDHVKEHREQEHLGTPDGFIRVKITLWHMKCV